MANDAAKSQLENVESKHMMNLISFLRRHLNTIVDFFLFILIYLYLFQYFPLHYINLDTVVTGGDTASHFKTVAYLKDVLLPQGKVIGWYPGNYGGYPLFIFYFPLLYVAAVAMSFLMPLTVSFKIVTVIGPFLLPLCTYAMLRLCRFRFPGPGLAAAASLLFLFNTSNSMWGGNLYSTLAGEFSYAFSFSITFMFWGMLYRLIHQIHDGEEKFDFRLLVAAIFLLFLIGLSHGFTLILCCLSVLYFLLFPRFFVRKSLLILTVFGVGGLLFAGWFMQLFYNIPYTTAFNILWTFGSISEVIPGILVPPQIIFLLASLYACIPGHFRWQVLSRDERRIIGFLWYIIVVCVLCYFSSETLHLPDIRFIPFIHFLTTVWGFAYVAVLFTNRFVSRVLPYIGFCSVVLWMSFFRTDVAHWIKWNMQGFERAPRWNTFRSINSNLLGNVGEPRVAYEHNTTTNGMGTVRAFESLPYFSGRATIEGLYFQSSLLSPFVFYAQSLYSKQISCPFPDYPCSRFDLKRAVDYLDLFNVNQLIFVSKEAKAEVRKLSTHYQLQKAIRYSPYEIWKVKGDSQYVQVLSEEPQYVEPQNFRFKFYQWFRDYPNSGAFLYTLPEAHKTVYGLDKIPIPPSSTNKAPKNPETCQIDSQLNKETVEFQTNCLGQPHLVKVAYHPGWQVTGAEGPYAISPAWLLVYPTQNQVKLTFDNVGPRVVGLWLNGLGLGLFLLIIGFAFVPALRGGNWTVLFEKLSDIKALNRLGYGLFLILFVGFFLSVLYDVFSPGYHATFKQAERAYTIKEYERAQQGFARVLERWPGRPTNDKVYYFLGLSYYLQYKCSEAIPAFREILQYRDSEWLAEAYYHLGICAQQQEQWQMSRAHYDYIINELNDPYWTKHAKNRLEEIKGK